MFDSTFIGISWKHQHTAVNVCPAVGAYFLLGEWGGGQMQPCT